MKSQLLLLFMLFGILANSQVNRYTELTPSRYQPNDYSSETYNKTSYSTGNKFYRQSETIDCERLIAALKENYGTTYTSYNSSVISKVTFYELTIEYSTYHFAIVCFKQKYSYSCSEYLYLVGSNTKLYYSMNYLGSAGEAFWEYIHPYNENLNCAPNFE